MNNINDLYNEQSFLENVKRIFRTYFVLGIIIYCKQAEVSKTDN